MTTLGRMKKGQDGHVVGFADNVDKAYRAKLLALGVTPNTHVKIERIAPLGDPMQVSIRGAQISLRKAEANAIEVEVNE